MGSYIEFFVFSFYYGRVTKGSLRYEYLDSAIMIHMVSLVPLGPFTQEELDSVLRKIKNRKAAGLDEIASRYVD